MHHNRRSVEPGLASILVATNVLSNILPGHQRMILWLLVIRLNQLDQNFDPRLPELGVLVLLGSCYGLVLGKHRMRDPVDTKGHTHTLSVNDHCTHLACIVFMLQNRHWSFLMTHVYRCSLCPSRQKQKVRSLHRPCRKVLLDGSLHAGIQLWLY